MSRGWSSHRANSSNSWCAFALIVILSGIPLAASVVTPASNCYALDNSSYLLDFSSWIGHPFTYEGKEADLVVRFCKDVESRSQAGYIDFGRYTTPQYFEAGTWPVNFIQMPLLGKSRCQSHYSALHNYRVKTSVNIFIRIFQDFHNGDLISCEQTFDKMGRTSQISILCGNCLNGECQGELGCICSVTYDRSKCRVFVELAIPCVKPSSRVFKGFTVGYNPRSSEVVYNGMTQLGYEKINHEFSFGTEQTHVSLYLTAISALSGLVGKPNLKVIPDTGLEVKLSGSGASGRAPTTLSPTILVVNWRCEVALDTPYEVSISVPVEGYDSIEFTLTKLCDYRQAREGDATRGWVTFGVLSCIFIILITLFCCGGFIYKTRVEHQHGLDALPGMTYLSACLEAVSGPRGYTMADDTTGNFRNQVSWEQTATSAQATQRTNERTYGSI